MTLSSYRILVASNTNSITSLLFDPHGSTLDVTSEVVVGPSPSWITAHPTNPSLAFTGLIQGDGILVALTFDDTGNGTVVGRMPSGGAVPASLLATMDTLFVSNVRRSPPKYTAYERYAFAYPCPSARMTLGPPSCCCTPKRTVRLWDGHGRSYIRLAPVLPRR
jgi:hypothetical protein